MTHVMRLVAYGLIALIGLHAGYFMGFSNGYDRHAAIDKATKGMHITHNGVEE